MRHVVGVEVLLQLAVDPQLDLQLLWIGHFVGGHQIWANRRKGGARLHLVEHVGGGHHTTGRAVDEVDVTKHMVHGVGGGHAAGGLANHQAEFGFAFKHRSGKVGQHHGVAGANDAARGLVEGVDGRGLFEGAVFHVVDRHALDVGGLGHGGTDAHRTHGHAGASGRSGFQAGAEIAKVGDQTVHAVAGAHVGNVGHHRGDIDHLIAFEHAQAKVIEMH